MKFFKISEKFKLKKSKKQKLNKKLSDFCQKLSNITAIYLEYIHKFGSFSVIKNQLPNFDVEKFILQKIKQKFEKKKFLKLPKKLGAIKIFYINDALKLEFYGFLRYFIKKISIQNSQILNCFYDIFEQIDNKIQKNSDRIKNKLDNIFWCIDNNIEYKCHSESEKTLYDLILLVISNYYNFDNTDVSYKSQVSMRAVDLILSNLSSLIENTSKNFKLNFKISYESKILKILNKKNNHVKIKKILSILNINIDVLIKNLANKYIYKNFYSSLNEILYELINTYLTKFNNKNLENSKFYIPNFPFNLTMTIGSRNSVNFCFFTKSQFKNCYLEISNNSNFFNSKIVKTNMCAVYKTFPTINFGITAKYKTKRILKHTTELTNLKQDSKYFYRICTKLKNKTFKFPSFQFITQDNKKSLKCLVFADSQGMVRNDYDIFKKILNISSKKIPNTDFSIHLGDFVDDGNNEEYWSWLLNSNFWESNPVIPVAGNHEKNICEIGKKFACENSIIGHFNLKNLPPQDTSTGVYFSFIHKNTLFIVINTNDTDENGYIKKSQIDWAIKTSENSKTNWKILLTHKFPYSNGPHYGAQDLKKIGYQIKELAYLAEIDVVIGGHDHVYVRTPILNLEKNVHCERKITPHENNFFDTYIKNYGTLFVIPGASGVKNYRQNLDAKIPSDYKVSLDTPTFSELEVSKNQLYFLTYSCNIHKNNLQLSTKLIDSFSIIKKENKLNGLELNNLISKLSDLPWLPQEKILKKIDIIYRKMDYNNKILVNNYNKLEEIIHIRKSFKKIQTMQIAIATNKYQFLESLGNPEIGTIIMNSPEIKLENKFGFENFYEINRNLRICGNSSLKFATFRIKKNTMLILDENITIENSRRTFSLYKSINAIEMEENSKLVIRGNASFLTDFRRRNSSHAIKIFGNNCKIYIDQESTKVPCFPKEKFISDGERKYKFQVIWRENIL